MTGDEPFLKWAGGKRWLLASKQFQCPDNFNRYIEPFLGGGAVFFHLRPPQALLSDINAELIETYATVRTHFSEIERLLEIHEDAHCEEYYYSIRTVEPASAIDRAARFIYLNRTCWNGLYRVNRRNEFNVPMGTKTKVAFPTGFLEGIAARLSDAKLLCCDFEHVINEAGCGDFLFVDPPYTVNHNFNGFLKYNERIFSWEDQIRLKEAALRAASRGAYVVITNADHNSVRELYAEGFRYQEVERASVLAGKSGARGRATEALFTANF